jgi:hypothetical protein
LRKSIFVAVPLAVLALAAPAAAHSSKHATTYKANVVAVQAQAAKAGKTGVRGDGKLVDGSRRDKVQLHVKGLTAGESYTWSVRSATGDADACAGDAVEAFEYGALVARRHGHTAARSRSTDFAAEDGTTYAVVVTAADGTDVACGEFKSKADRRAEKAKRKAERRAEHTSRGKHKDASAGEDEQGDEDQQGDDDDPAGDDDAELADDDPAADDPAADASDDD